MQPIQRRSHAPFFVYGIVVVAILVVLFFAAKAIVLARQFMHTTGMTPTTLASLVFDSGADLSPIDGRVNILLLGVAGGDHDGADLTDTILVLSFHEQQKTLGMISVPRDIWSDTLKDKVNSAYHYGEAKKSGGGLTLSKAIISDVVGLPLQHALMLDFSGFRKIIDMVGGVDVDVSESFTDSQFPIPGKENDECDGDPEYACRYEVLRFEKGLQHMDGERALQYVRSRHATGDEGSDFARGRRQQEVILSLRTKLMSQDIYLHPKQLESLYAAFDEATDTDMNISQLLTVGKLFLKTPKEQVRRVAIDSLLYTPPSSWYGRYVLLPTESFDAIHAFIATTLQ